MTHLRFLGGAIVEGESGAVAGFASRRHPVAILALLATAPHHTLSRGKLVGLLWPESPEEKGRSRLNTDLHQIRSELGNEVVASVGEDLRLDADSVDCDVCRFVEAIAAGDQAAAVGLYKGPFLDGFRLGDSVDFEHRVDRERARLRDGYRRALEALAERAAATGDLDESARWWQERASDDPYDSRVTRRLMETLAGAGNPAAALRVARVHEQLLEKELGAAPSGEIRRLIVELRSGATGEWTPPAVGRAAEARPIETPSPAPGSRTRPPAPERGPRGARAVPLAALSGVGLLAALAVGGWYVLGSAESAPSAPAGRAIAVLPFESSGGGRSTAFAEGLQRDLSSRLATVAGVDVILSGMPARRGGSEKPLPEIARELGADWVLAVEIEGPGEEFQVDARLADARRGRQAWAESYRRTWTAADLFEIEGEMIRAIVAALELEIAPERMGRLLAVPSERIAAWEIYLHARGLDRDGRNPPDVAPRKIELYRRALLLDSTFAEAWAWLADAYLGRAWGSGEVAWTDSAATALRHALELDSELPDAHAQLGDLHWTLGRTQDAIDAYERALELRSGHHHATNNLIVLLKRRGRHADAMRLLESARHLSKDSAEAIAHLAILNAELGRDEAAIAWLEYGRKRGYSLAEARFYVELFYRGDLERARRALEELAAEEGEGYRITRRRAAIALYEGDWKEARRQYRSLYPGVARGSAVLFGGFLWDPLGLAWALDRLGDREEAVEIARDVVRATDARLTSDPDAGSRHRMATALLLVGDTTAAMDWLEAAVDVGFRDVLHLATVPVLAPLRDHPRFRALLQRTEILVAEERRRVEAEGWGEVPPPPSGHSR